MLRRFYKVSRDWVLGRCTQSLSRLRNAIYETNNRKYKDGEEHGGVMETTAAVELVLPNISDHRLLDQYLEVAVKICAEYESKR